MLTYCGDHTWFAYWHKLQTVTCNGKACGVSVRRTGWLQVSAPAISERLGTCGLLLPTPSTSAWSNGAHQCTSTGWQHIVQQLQNRAQAPIAEHPLLSNTNRHCRNTQPQNSWPAWHLFTAGPAHDSQIISDSTALTSICRHSCSNVCRKTKPYGHHGVCCRQCARCVALVATCIQNC